LDRTSLLIGWLAPCLLIRCFYLAGSGLSWLRLQHLRDTVMFIAVQLNSLDNTPGRCSKWKLLL